MKGKREYGKDKENKNRKCKAEPSEIKDIFHGSGKRNYK